MLETILRNALDQNESVRVSCERQIKSLYETNSYQFIDSLTSLFENFIEIDERALNTGLVLMHQILNNTRIDHIQLERIRAACEKIILFNSNNCIRGACFLYGTVLGILIRSGNYPDIIKEVWCHDDNILGLKNLLLSLRVMLEKTVLDKSQAQFLFCKVFNLLDNEELIEEAIEIMCTMSENILEGIPSELKKYFLEKILFLTNTNKFNVFALKLWHSIAKNAFSLLKEVIDPLLIILQNYINESENELTIMWSLMVTKTIVNHQIKCNDFFLNYQSFDFFFQPLIRIISLIPSDQPNSDEDWNLHLAGISTLTVFSYAFPSHSSILFLPVIEKFSQSNDQIQLEISLLLLYLLMFTEKFQEYKSVIQFLHKCISNPSVRVRNITLKIIEYLSEKNICLEDFISFIPQFIELLNDHQLNVVLILSIFGELSKCQGFPIVQTCQIFFQLFHSSNFLITSAAFNYIFSVLEPIENVGSVMILINPTIELMKESFLNQKLYSFQDEIFNLMNSILEKVTIGALDYLPIIYELYTKSIQSYCLIPICCLVKYFTNELQAYLPEIISALETFLTESSDDDDISIYCSCLSILSVAPTIKPFLGSIVNRLIDISKCVNQSILCDIISTINIFCKIYPEILSSFIHLLTNILFEEEKIIKEKTINIDSSMENWIDLIVFLLKNKVENSDKCGFSFLLMIHQKDIDSFEVIEACYNLIVYLVKNDAKSVIDFETQTNVIQWVLTQALQYETLHDEVSDFIDYFFQIIEEC